LAESNIGCVTSATGTAFPASSAVCHRYRLQNLRNSGDLAEIVRRYRRARLVAAGHVHRATLTGFAGVTATICPAPTHAIALDLDSRWPPSFTIEPPAFHLHLWFPGGEFGTVVTHWVPIGEFDGPHRFFDDHGHIL
jgi:3',5'-cyclic-AMP phosphodiesterase